MYMKNHGRDLCGFYSWADQAKLYGVARSLFLNIHRDLCAILTLSRVNWRLHISLVIFGFNVGISKSANALR